MKHPKPDLNDFTLWKGIQRGDKPSFDCLYGMYVNQLFRYGMRICSSSAVVEDAIHDVFLDLWLYRNTLSDTTSVKFYLFGAFRRRIIKNETKEISTSIFNFEHQDDEQLIRKTLSQEDIIIHADIDDEKINLVKRHLNNLSPRNYEALVLRFYENFDYAQIGEILHINDQSARNLIQRALEQLRRYSSFTNSGR